MFPISNKYDRELCKEKICTNSWNEFQFTDDDGLSSSVNWYSWPENGFRGFEKLPKVVCERIDITPYLDKQKTRKPVLKMHNPLGNSDMNMFLRECSVSLVQEDLEKLKIIYNNNINSKKKVLMNTNDTLKKCKFCDKRYSSANRLQNHIQNKHMVVYKSESKAQKRVSFSEQVIIHELKEYHHCRKCPKVYEDYQTLKTHMKQAHKKRKCYICFYCNKDFVDRMFFKVHIKMHCNLCGQFFVSKKMYNDHRRTVCRVLKKYQCKTCNETYFSFLCLKDHSYDHQGVIYVCDICKEICNSKCKLLHHIQFLHCRKQPKSLYDTVHVGTDIMYECNSCDQCSNNKDTMENHTTSLPDLKNRIRTGYKDYYFCDQCSEQFDTETKMLRHKWTHFLKANKSNGNENVNTKKEIKMTYKIGKELPLFLQPKLVLKRLKTQTETSICNSTLAENNTHTETNTLTKKTMNINFNNSEVMGIIKPVVLESLLSNTKKAIVDPVSKKTIFSKHRCEVCKNYFSSNFCLRRHIQTMHEKNENLQCTRCEEIFVWPSLLESHNCIRMNIPEMPFADSRPDIQFDNRHEYLANSSEMITWDNGNMYQDDIEFDMPAPIVELTEFEHVRLVVNDETNVNFNNVQIMDTSGYRIIMQEVPIEF